MDENIRAQIVDDAPAMVAFHDLKQRICWANKAYCEATGRNLEELVGATCWKAWGLFEKCRGCPVVVSMETGQPAEAELTPWNQQHWPESQGSWLSKATPVRDPEGALVGVIEAAFDITEIVEARQKAEKQRHDLGERVKELRCLMDVLETANRDADSDDLIGRAVELLPPGWHYPEIALARIIFDEKEVCTGDFVAAVAVQSADIVVKGVARGKVEVGYTEEREPLDEGPFLSQERKLLDAIAGNLGLTIEHIEAVDQLGAANQQLEASNQQLQAVEQQLQAYNQQLQATNQQLEAGNMQLRATEQQLLATEQQLRANNQMLVAKNAELMASETKYRTLVESSLQGVVIAQNGPMRLRFANTAMESISGFSVEELLSMEPAELAELIHRDDRARFFENFKRRVTGEAVPSVAEYRIRRKDGAATWALCYSSAIDYLGERATLTTFVDITDRRQAEEALRRRLRYEHLLAEISAISVEAGDLGAFFERCLTLLGEKIGVSRTYLFEYDEQADTMDNSHEWCAEGITPQKDELQAVPGSDFPWWLETLRREDVVCYSDIEEIPDDATKEIIRLQGILSVLVVPLFVQSRFFGFIGFDDCTRHRKWLPEDVDILLSISRIIATVIERDRLEDARRKADSRFRAAQDMSPDGFTILRPVRDDSGQVIDFVWVYVNPTVARINRTDPEKVVGKRLLELFPGHRGTPFLSAYTQVAETGEPFTFEDRYTGDGLAEPVWFRIVVVPIDEDIAILAQDITERKQREEVLRRFEWLNEKEQGKPGETSDVYSPPYGDVTALNTCRVIADAVDKETLASMARDLMDLLDTSVAVYEANGDYAFGGFDSDWCRLLDQSSFALCKTDDGEKALRCGAWLCHENCWNDSAKEAIHSGAPTDIECVGGIRLYAVPILAAGEVVGAITIGYGTPPDDAVTLRGLSERFGCSFDEIRRAANAYKPRPRFIVDVAKRRCRTVARMIGDAVQKARLEAQLAQADRLSSMGTLAAGVAHEINNPLAYTLYNLETAAEDLPTVFSEHRKMSLSLNSTAQAKYSARVFATSANDLDDLLDRIREALDGAQRIRAITRTLGTFARVDDTREAPIDIRQAAEHARNMARNETKYRAHLLLDLAPTPPVLGSEGKLAQVFLNLLINAAHAIDEGDVERNSIRIRTYSEDDEVIAEVSDTGKGIPRENLKRLFDPFFTTKPIGEGSGLGLAISKKIIADMGGDITCESQEGQGTTFRIRLPELRGDESKRQDGTKPAEPARFGPGGRVLVVDDEAGIRAAISRMLGRDNHEVIAAASGAEGQELLERDQRFDLIILDLMMPKVSGMDLHRWIVDTYPELAARVIFVTGGVFTSGARAYLSKVDNLRLEKPLDTTTFRKLVNDLVASKREQPTS